MDLPPPRPRPRLALLVAVGVTLLALTGWVVATADDGPILVPSLIAVATTASAWALVVQVRRRWERAEGRRR